jgi:hypothetical protein
LLSRYAAVLLLAVFALLASMNAWSQNQVLTFEIIASSYALDDGNAARGNTNQVQVCSGCLLSTNPSEQFTFTEVGSSTNWIVSNNPFGTTEYLSDNGSELVVSTSIKDTFTFTNAGGGLVYFLDTTTGRYMAPSALSDGAGVVTGSSAYPWTVTQVSSGGGTTKIDDFDASILYALPDGATGDGGWFSGSGISGDYMGTEHSTNWQTPSPSGYGGTFQGVSASVNFTGTGITWIGKKGPNYGIATYAIDGGTPVTFDAYNSSEIDQNPNVSITGLTNGSHVLTISLTNSKNSASSNYYQTVDAFQIQGSPLDLSQATVVTPCTNPSMFEYAYGSWGGGCNQTGGDGSDGPAPAGHLVSGSSSTYIQWTFTGSLIEVLGRPDFEDGGISVSIDGGTPQTYSMQAGNADVDAYNYMVIFAKKLSTGGSHTIRLTPTGSGAPPSEPDNYIQISHLIAFP